MTQITLSDLLLQADKRNPATLYTQLRQQGPLCYVSDFGGTGAWVVTTYEDAIVVLKDPRFIRDSHKVAPPEDEQHSSGNIASLLKLVTWRRDMATVDPTDHTRLRHLASKAFTPHMIERLRPRIQQITDELLDAVQQQGQMDLINDFAFPLPITVIGELLGIPVEDRKQFRTWTDAMLAMNGESQQVAANVSAIQSFVSYIKTLLSEKRAHPGSDLTSGLVQAEENGDALDEGELISTIFLLIVAGHVTTVNLIGIGMLALLEHPEQMHLLQQDLSLIPSAIEELLRYTAPVSLAAPRWAREDVVMRDKLIRKGEMVFVSLVAANTDPQHFHDPELLDITRHENQHLAFGKGIHYCLGAPLARLEGQIAFSTLLQRLPHLRLAVDPEQLTWARTPVLRSLTSLPVTF